jgi:hypothetical protein
MIDARRFQKQEMQAPRSRENIARCDAFSGTTIEKRLGSAL